MSKVEDFLTSTQEQEIIEAIRLAEKDTSGEIRVHLEKKSDKNVIKRAEEVFSFLRMVETEQQNGVLFYVAIDDRKFCVIGDKGINDLVVDTFWNSISELVLDQFKKDNYVEGLIKGIIETGNKLKQYFPYQDNDKNELPNSISLS